MVHFGQITKVFGLCRGYPHLTLEMSQHLNKACPPSLIKLTGQIIQQEQGYMTLTVCVLELSQLQTQNQTSGLTLTRKIPRKLSIYFNDKVISVWTNE